MNKHLQKFQHAPSHTVARWAGMAWGIMGLGLAGALGILSGCSTPPPLSPPVRTPAPAAPVPEAVNAPMGGTSLARSQQEYKKDAAAHLYGTHAHLIYKGRMPPMLQAVGVLKVDIDQQGSVQALQWLRAPQHVPQVMADIERMVKSAAPYPAPQHLGPVSYTDVWLWHRSGQFQLDTLTEGQD